MMPSIRAGRQRSPVPAQQRRPVSWAARSFSLISLMVLSLLATTATAQDPVNDFCRRFGHQTAVIDRKLYIDGGYINYNPISKYPQNYSNTYLAYQDLDHQVNTQTMPQLYANLSKNATIPSVNGGILWTDDVNKKFYLYGGEYSQGPAVDYILYSYDTLYDVWYSMGRPQQSISNVAYGGGTSVSSTGMAYYYGGWLSNVSMPGVNGRTATNSLISYEMDSNTWTNSSGPDSTARAEGVMVYIPASDGGMLVYFGGFKDSGNGTMVAQEMKEIMLYDINSGNWYTQEASGDVPENRARFCAGATWADDYSSYNIYLYGGAGMPSNTTGFDDVYILSLPSFTWINLYDAEQYPHHSLSCNVVDNAQMIIIGGTFPLSKDCDSPDQFGSHNLVMSMEDPGNSAWYIYQKNLTDYKVPDPITKVIGGDGNGGATLKSPKASQSPDLKVLMTRHFDAPQRSPTRNVDPNGSQGAALGGGAIAGIVIGGVAGLCLIAGAVWFFCFRRKRDDTPKPNQYSPASGAPDMATQSPYNQSGAPWSPSDSHHTSPTMHTPVSPYQQTMARHPSGVPSIPAHPVEMGDGQPGGQVAYDPHYAHQLDTNGQNPNDSSKQIGGGGYGGAWDPSAQQPSPIDQHYGQYPGGPSPQAPYGTHQPYSHHGPSELDSGGAGAHGPVTTGGTGGRLHEEL